MNQLILGIISGLCILGFPILTVGIMRLIEGLTQTVVLLNTLVAQLNRLEHITTATLTASETFVDALQAANDVPGVPPDFEDLRKSFEDGVKNFEDMPEDDDEEPWKKK